MTEHLTPVPGAQPVYDEETGREIERVATCGTCGRSWNDAAISDVTPAPSGRCPFEDEHDEDRGDVDRMVRELREIVHDLAEDGQPHLIAEILDKAREVGR